MYGPLTLHSYLTVVILVHGRVQETLRMLEENILLVGGRVPIVSMVSIKTSE